jgi:hypothetical protein
MGGGGAQTMSDGGGRCDKTCPFSDRCSAGTCVKTTTPNLIVNPGAEFGLDGWLATSRAVVGIYGAPGFAGLGDPGPSDRGSRLFGCPPLGDFSQEIDLSPYAAAIAAGRVVAEYSAYLGGVGASVDGASISILFHDATGRLISSSYINGPNDAVRNRQTRLDFFGNNIVIPSGAHTIRVRLGCFGNEFNAYGLADNLSLAFTGI